MLFDGYRRGNRRGYRMGDALCRIGSGPFRSHDVATRTRSDARAGAAG